MSPELPIIVMAGGKSTRLEKDVEKPLLEIHGRRMIEFVIDSVIKVAEDFSVATSPYTSQTKNYCEERKYNIVETRGKGYIEDSKHIYRQLGPFISIACDIPFIRPEDIQRMHAVYQGKSLTGVVTRDQIPEAVNPDKNSGRDQKEPLPVGVNVFTAGSEESRDVILENGKLALNVNTVEDLKTAESIMENLSGTSP